MLEPLVASLLAGVDYVGDVHDTSAQPDHTRLSILPQWREPHRLKSLIDQFLNKQQLELTIAQALRQTPDSVLVF